MEIDETTAYAALAVLHMSGPKSSRLTGWDFASRMVMAGQDEPHHGDCTGVAITCSRCIHDEAMERAREVRKFLADGGWHLTRRP